MEPFRVFAGDTRWVVETCIKQVATYPGKLSMNGQTYLEKRGYCNGRRNNGICCLMPFLLQDAFELKREIARKVSLGTTYILLYFYSQDEVMDTGEGEYKGHLLPLSNMFYQDFISLFYSLLPSKQLFWSLSKRYIREWASSVIWEREEHWGKAKNFSEDDLMLLSRKAAPLKISCAAMSLLGGREDTVEPLENMVDYSQVVFQLLDDFKDWRTDLFSKNYTYLLVKVMEYLRLDHVAELSEPVVQKVLDEGSVLKDIFGLAEKYSELTMKSISDINAPYLKTYFKILIEYCTSLRKATLK
jgi:hypothetical protein